jgi:hypothetical protein
VFRALYRFSQTQGLLQQRQSFRTALRVHQYGGQIDEHGSRFATLRPGAERLKSLLKKRLGFHEPPLKQVDGA